MIVADTRMSIGEKELLASLIGKPFESYCHDAEIMPGTDEFAWGIIGLRIGGVTYVLTDDREPHNVHGDEDDIPVIHFAEAASGEITSRLVGIKQKDWPVGKVIEDIRIHEDTQVKQADGEDAFEYDFTAAVVFQFASTQLVFEGSGWIMESVYVLKGPDAESRIQPAIDDIPESERDVKRAARAVISLKGFKADDAGA